MKNKIVSFLVPLSVFSASFLSAAQSGNVYFSLGSGAALFLKGDGFVWGTGLNDIVAIESGVAHSLFLKSDGSLSTHLNHIEFI